MFIYGVLILEVFFFFIIKMFFNVFVIVYDFFY